MVIWLITQTESDIQGCLYNANTASQFIRVQQSATSWEKNSLNPLSGVEHPNLALRSQYCFCFSFSSRPFVLRVTGLRVRTSGADLGLWSIFCAVKGPDFCLFCSFLWE